jgi:hypothetical protein
MTGDPLVETSGEPDERCRPVEVRHPTGAGAVGRASSPRCRSETMASHRHEQHH